MLAARLRVLDAAPAAPEGIGDRVMPGNDPAVPIAPQKLGQESHMAPHNGMLCREFEIARP
jgi:hypothetical protein